MSLKGGIEKLSSEAILSIDLGTSALKVCLYDLEFNTIAKVTAENVTYFPKPNWAEQDQIEWWNNAKKLIKEVIKKSKIDPKNIKGVGICGQCHGVNLVDKFCNPLHPCLIWPDLRSIAQAEKIKKELGIYVSPHYTAAKLLWIRENRPDLLEKAYKILLPKDFLRTKLTGDFCTDIYDAINTELFNYKTFSYSMELINFIGIPLEKLPEVRLSTDIVGTVSEEASIETGLTFGTPVITGRGDGSPELFRYFMKPFETLLIYLGTAPAILIPAGDSLFPFKSGFMSAGGGALLKWFKENFAQFEVLVSSELGVSAYSLLDQEAQKIEIGSEGLLFLPHMMGERCPHNPHAKGVLYGLSLGHTRVHIYRAILEGIALQLYSIYNSLKEEDTRINPNRIVIFGGGAKSFVWKKIFADLFNLPVYVPNEEETAALNVAVLTTVGLKIYSDLQEAVKKINITWKDMVTPSKENHDKYIQLYIKYRELENSLFQHTKFLPKPRAF